MWNVQASYTSPISGGRVTLTLKISPAGWVNWVHEDGTECLPCSWMKSEAYNAVTWFLRVYADMGPEIHLT